MIITTINNFYNDIQILHLSQIKNNAFKTITSNLLNVNDQIIGTSTLIIDDSKSHLMNNKLCTLGQLFNNGIITQDSKNSFINTIENIISIKSKDEQLFKLQLIYKPQVDSNYEITKIFFVNNPFVNPNASTQFNLQIAKSRINIDGSTVCNILIPNATKNINKIQSLDVFIYSISLITDKEIDNITLSKADIKEINPIKFEFKNNMTNDYFVEARLNLTDNTFIECGQQIYTPISIHSSTLKSNNISYTPVNTNLFDINLLPNNIDKQIQFKFSPKVSVTDGKTGLDYSKLFYYGGMKLTIENSIGQDISNEFQILINKKKDYNFFYYNIFNLKNKITAFESDQTNSQDLQLILDTYRPKRFDDLPFTDTGIKQLMANLDLDTIRYCIKTGTSFPLLFAYWWNIIGIASISFEKTKLYAPINPGEWIDFDTTYIDFLIGEHTISSNLTEFESIILFNKDDIQKKYGGIKIYIWYPIMLHIDNFDKTNILKKEQIYVESGNKKIYLYTDIYKQQRDSLANKILLYDVPIL